MGVGSGVKCGLNVWQALREVRDVQPAWEHRLSAEEAERVRKDWARQYGRGGSGVAGAMRTLLLLALFVLLLAVVAPQLGELWEELQAVKLHQ